MQILRVGSWYSARDSYFQMTWCPMIHFNFSEFSLLEHCIRRLLVDLLLRVCMGEIAC